MEGIDFHEDNFHYNSNNLNENSYTNKMSMFLIKKGIAKNKKEADKIMLIFSAVLLVTSGFIINFYVLESDPTSTPYSDLPYSEQQKIPEEDRELLEKLNN
jgi:hypothetical protein